MSDVVCLLLDVTYVCVGVVDWLCVFLLVVFVWCCVLWLVVCCLFFGVRCLVLAG